MLNKNLKKNLNPLYPSSFPSTCPTQFLYIPENFCRGCLGLLCFLTSHSLLGPSLFLKFSC